MQVRLWNGTTRDQGVVAGRYEPVMRMRCGDGSAGLGRHS